jgi:hypothetical protein
MAIEVLNRNLPGFTGNAWLVKDSKSDQHFVVSGTNAMLSGWEVLVFPADSDGEVTSWGEVAGGRGISHDEAISDLEDRLAKGSNSTDMMGNY